MVNRHCTALAILLAASAAAQAQPPASARVCTAAIDYLRRNQIPESDRSVFFSGSLDRRQAWTQSDASPITVGDITVPAGADQVYVAYFLVRSVPDGGALSAKISIAAAANEQPTNYVNLHREAIKRARDHCLSHDLPQMDRSVRVNEYIDYHNPYRGGLSSDLEDFHFRYPVGATGCTATNDLSNLSSFEFDDVSRTVGDSFLARYFSFTTTAYAVGSKFSDLTSELHYRELVRSPGTCVGFIVPLRASPQASLIIHELGFAADGGPVRRSWSIHR